MPVTRSEFEKGTAEDSTEAKVLRFLGAEPGSAYNAVELGKAISHSSEDAIDEDDGLSRLGRTFGRMSFRNELDEMAKRGLIESRAVRHGEGWDHYYSAKR
jgi:hypothetical protein